ncbi:MAG: hypothetical protein KF685_06560, partial [Acidobacteria bacterium]|nr:hypothetical protein [Acidobacteriota bacterium]
QIAWSSKGPDNRTTSGRSEQVNETLGIASTYACYSCWSNREMRITPTILISQFLKQNPNP